MDRCEVCTCLIPSVSSNHRKRLAQVREKYSDSSIVVCSTCIRKIQELEIRQLLQKAINRRVAEKYTADAVIIIEEEAINGTENSLHM